nr:unnamed protein product [Callosobruchus chinensis]
MTVQSRSPSVPVLQPVQPSLGISRLLRSDVIVQPEIRLDFLTLRLAQPNSNGTCITDALVVTGGASIVPIICGENSGQHIYVDYNNDSPITISISTSTTTSTAVAWNIKITQIGCNCPTRAPTGCLQYFATTAGTVRSFNYGNSINQNGTRQLANLNYGVCIAMIPGYCGIRWSQSPGTYSFSISNNTFDNVGDGSVATPNAEIFGTNCTTDFVVVPAPSFVNGTSPNTDRFCGNGFAPVISTNKPFIMSVITNSNEINETGNAGFSLDFAQQRCASSIFVG